MLDAGLFYDIFLSILLGLSFYLHFLKAKMIQSLLKRTNLLREQDETLIRMLKQHVESNQIQAAHDTFEIDQLKRRVGNLPAEQGHEEAH